MALRRNKLPRFWLGITLGLVTAFLGATYWWERQLPQKLEQAGARGNLDSCLLYSDQLEALRWLGGSAPQEQGQCRRLKAAQLWQQEQWLAALRLQVQLVNSPAGTPADQRQFEGWQTELQTRALDRFQQGDLGGALKLLAVIGEDHNSTGTAAGDNFKEIWARNQQQLQRAKKLVAEARWWEALDGLNRLDHPWFRGQAQPLQAKVQAGINKMAAHEREHDGHGSLPHTVPADQLDAQVQARLAKGMDEWSAFKAACKGLGGKVVEAGPESACQR
ncbi:hypothetical protein [Cyanobium sp. WAJ14-Wanaka]|uniref:hypothetical protein n=1 Tax=Cyanobium sp. WAJ14-Wanaka TaxID=2823725 RepID=UPI0020CD5A96|nr:hypothetical protein [Cyanobium sp. WAJ14-Wanaka]MCP9775196.1 hypothetical protein [Cyanobium sp. WAJ14-Wanaka]